MGVGRGLPDFSLPQGRHSLPAPRFSHISCSFPEEPAGLAPPSTQVYKGEALTQALQWNGFNYSKMELLVWLLTLDSLQRLQGPAPFPMDSSQAGHFTERSPFVVQLVKILTVDFNIVKPYA